MSLPHILLVHGAYHRASHFRVVKKKLQDAGYAVSDLDLPAAGATSAEHEVGGLAADAAAITDAIEQIAQKSDAIVPVLHSYAGICGSDAVADLSDESKKKIKRIVFLVSLVVPRGQSLVGATGGKTAPWAAFTEDGKFSFVPDPIPAFCYDVDPDLAAESAASIVRHSMSCFTEPTRSAGWTLFPKTYVFCTEDRAVPYEVQQALFAGMSDDERRGWDFEKLDCGHSPALAKPDETTLLIRRAAGEKV